MLFADVDLAARVEHAEASLLRDCDDAARTTLPGSKSQQNGQKHGFQLFCSRAILVRGPGESCQ